jgi:hypothetical protein
MDRRASPPVQGELSNRTKREKQRLDVIGNQRNDAVTQESQQLNSGEQTAY